MRSPTALYVALLVAWGIVPARGAEPATLPQTRLTERGKLLVSDDLKQPLGTGWKAAKGKWEVVAGSLQAAEVPTDNHGAVARYALTFDDAVIQYSFKLDGAKGTTLSINTAKAHLCRVLIAPSGVTIRKDDMDKAGPDKVVAFQQLKHPIEPGVWHTLVVEIRGQEMLATIDDEHIVLGQHEAIAAMKANFGLTVAGQSVSFKDLRVWEALPNKSWEATRAELQAKLKTAAG